MTALERTFGDMDEEEIDLKKLFLALFQEKWKIICVVILCTLGSVMYTYSVSPTFNIKSSLSLATKPSGLLTKSESGSSVQFINIPPLDFDTELGIIKSSQVLNKVIQKANLEKFFHNGNKESANNQDIQKWLSNLIKIETQKNNKSTLSILIHSQHVERDKKILESLISVYQEDQIQRTMKKISSILTVLGQKDLYSTQYLSEKAKQNILVLQPVSVDASSIKPSKKLIIIATFAISGFISVLVVLLLAINNKGIYRPDEIEALGINVLSIVPMIRNGNTVQQDAVEALKFICASLNNRSHDTSKHLIMISAPDHNVGKLFINKCFSLAEIQCNKQVLVIDADMRENCLIKKINLSQNNITSISLASILESEDSKFGALFTDVENLDVIPAGDPKKNPTELLMKPEFQQLLSWANDHYDVVIINTPPVLHYADACIVGSYVKNNILITRARITTKVDILESVKRFNQSGVDVTGGIFNGV